MIVGCAGAGKTTLLKRLQKCSQQEINTIKSTVGLEIYEDIFEICGDENALKGLYI
jgi:GTPase SAR1 family protein